MKILEDNDLRNIPGLRWQEDEDKCAIASTISRRFRKDHLYFHGPKVLGIYYERETKKEATYARMAWEQRVGKNRLLEPTQIGDYDGIILFCVESERDIPQAFFRSKNMKSNLPDFNRSPRGGGGLAQKSPAEGPKGYLGCPDTPEGLFGLKGGGLS